MNPCMNCYKKNICLKELNKNLNLVKLALICKTIRTFILESEKNYINISNFFSIETGPYELVKSKIKNTEKIASVVFNNYDIAEKYRGDPEIYKGYDLLNGKSIEKFGEDQFYIKRNEIIVRILQNINNDLSIFEFASTYGFLALKIADSIKFKKYITTNFLQEVVSYTKKQGLIKKGIGVEIFDANEIPKRDLSEFNVFICTSLEHLEKDIEIISSLPPGDFIFSVPNFKDPTHFRIFNKRKEIIERYKNYIDILDIKMVQKNELKKYVVHSKKS